MTADSSTNGKLISSSAPTNLYKEQCIFFWWLTGVFKGLEDVSENSDYYHTSAFQIAKNVTLFN